MPRILKRLTLVILGVAAGLLAAEAGLRPWFPANDLFLAWDPHLDDTFVPAPERCRAYRVPRIS